MKSFTSKLTLFATVLALSTIFATSNIVRAEEGEQQQRAATSISISPVYKNLQLDANKTYEDSFKVTNNGASTMRFEVYAAPYSYTFSENDGSYKLGFNRENSYTQITRWITFQDANGSWVEKPTFSAEPDTSVEVKYRIVTPASIPAGGQYAVLFAHTLSSGSNTSGIKTEASPGLVVYGRSNGETISKAEISDLQIHKTMTVDGEEKNIINGTAKVKNVGNVDFMGSGTLEVRGIFGQEYYKTDSQSTKSKVSIIPDSELVVSDSWDGTPFFGLFSVSWKVTAAGETQELKSQMILIMPPVVIVIMISLLTIIIIWVIIVIRKRQERRSRFMA